MKFFWEVFVTLFVIIDPAGTVPVFLGLTRGRSRRDRNQLAWQATIVAFSVIVAFALFGRTILDYLGSPCPPWKGRAACSCCWSRWNCSPGRRASPPRPSSSGPTWPLSSAPRCW